MISGLAFASQSFAAPDPVVTPAWPVWPEEATATGTSVGPFPFWCDTGPSGSNSSKGAYKFTCLDRDTTVSHNSKLLYSHKKSMQITYRDNCDLTHFNGPKGVECAHRYMPDGKAFITSGDPDTGYCCQSFGHLPQTNPLPIPHPTFMNTCLKRAGPVPYNGSFFQGMVYNYTDVFAELPTYFWYMTSAEDEHPIEQGEGCVSSWGRKDECTIAGAVSKLGPKVGDPPFLAFEYQKFESSWFAEEEFTLPPVCNTDKLHECYNMECDDPGTTGLRHLDPTFRPL